mgnify:CR=1 FL=1
MGLDMYLNRESSFWNQFEKTDDGELITHIPECKITCNGESLYEGNPKRIIEEVGYWRKANAIHGWFMQHEGWNDESQSVIIPLNSLKELRNICLTVLNEKSLAEQFLPVTQGFFFGSYEYDDWYFEELQETVKIIDKIIEFEESGKNLSDSSWYEYQASW